MNVTQVEYTQREVWRTATHRGVEVIHPDGHVVHRFVGWVAA